MSLTRRTFLKSSAVLSPTLGGLNKPILKLPANTQLLIMATNWGFVGNMDAFCKAAKEAGYDGIEVWFPTKEPDLKELLAALNRYGLKIGYLVGSWKAYFKEHFLEFEKNLRATVAQKPLYINCHSGKDFFSFEQNCQFVELTNRISKESGVPISHETHRSRLAFAAPITKQYLEKYAEMQLTLDISHWCNVHESLLQDQPQNIQIALARTLHIHARIGHQEGPQVNDPRAPEWKDTVKIHFDWWDKVVENRIKAGEKIISFTTEFGPVSYMPALPYTQQPVANQWDINVFMMKTLRERYS